MRWLACVAIVCLAIVTVPPLRALLTGSPRIRSIVVFGDSLSDTNGSWGLSRHTWPADPAYHEGRFSECAMNQASPLTAQWPCMG